MAKNTEDKGDERTHGKGDVRRITRTQGKRLTRKMLPISQPIIKDDIYSEVNRFKPGEAERLRKAVI